MLKPMQYSVLCVLSALGVALVVANAALYFANRSAQAHVAARARYIEQSQSIGALYQDIARSLATLAVQHHDDEVTALLKEEGFTIKPAEGSARAAAGKAEEKP